MVLSLLAAGAAISGIGGGGALAYDALTHPVKTPAADARHAVNNHPNALGLDAAIRSIARDRRQYHYVATRPAGYRDVPIIGRRSTPITTGLRNVGLMGLPSASAQDKHDAPAMMQVLMNAYRAALAEAGCHYDVRCALRLAITECGWRSESCWGNDFGNVKAKWHLFWDGVSPVAWTPYESPKGVWILQGEQENKLEFYWAFDTPAEFFRFQRAIFAHSYPRVIAGYDQGGLEGLRIAEMELGRGWSYTPGPLRVLAGNRFWANMSRIGKLAGGDAWVR